MKHKGKKESAAKMHKEEKMDKKSEKKEHKKK